LKIAILRSGALGDNLILIPLLYHLQNNISALDLTLFIEPRYFEIFQSYDTKIHLKKFSLENSNYQEFSFFDFVFIITADYNSLLRRHFNNLKKENKNLFFFITIAEAYKLNISIYDFLISEFSKYLNLDVNDYSDINFFRNFIELPQQYNLKLLNNLAHTGSGSKNKNLELTELIFFFEKYNLTKENTNILLGPIELENQPFLLDFFRDFKILQDIANYQILIAILQNIDFYFGYDSGISHLYGLLNKRGVVIFKNSNATVWRPYSKKIEIESAFISNF